MDFEKIDINELLPQAEPFVAVGKLLHFDMTTTITETIVKADSFFVENGVLTPSGLIENIAQTCATRIGFINKYILKKSIQIGFIGAIRKLSLLRLPKADESMITRIDVREEVFGMTLVDAKIYSGEEVLAEGEMKIAVKTYKNRG